MNISYLLIGGNKGDRVSWLEKACEHIGRSAGPVLLRSSLYETAAWGKTDQSDFLNQALQIRTSLDAPALMDVLLMTEEKMGRRRVEKWGARLIDIDILFFNEEIIRQPQLVIPHPEIQNRRFALVPMEEIAPLYIHPLLRKSIRQLLAECPDELNVKKMKGM
ncbi:MAG TPA: 2-amino-4-hydroxy-6-hydroxymethyldihydropteridine diphosphokinase [Puia sp.]|nr:2-amino-4-hydroxy-6-hydroxymethyldihydropteridine diphosphokinase [Puia sp.]